MEQDRPRQTEKPIPEMPERAPKPKMAVFGGSFDPIHNGHLFIAGSLLRSGLADEVLFVPAKNPPHKADLELTPGADRLAMLQKATAAHPGLSVSDIELERDDGPSYTIDTMETLSRVFTEHRLLFVMGMDSLRDLSGWYRSGELVNRFDFLVYPRPGVRIPSSVELNPHFGPRNTKKLLDAVVDLPLLPISATAVRAAVARGGSLAGLVSDGIVDYIRKARLYRPSSPAPPPSTIS